MQLKLNKAYCNANQSSIISEKLGVSYKSMHRNLGDSRHCKEIAEKVSDGTWFFCEFLQYGKSQLDRIKIQKDSGIMLLF